MSVELPPVRCLRLTWNGSRVVASNIVALIRSFVQLFISDASKIETLTQKNHSYARFIYVDIFLISYIDLRFYYHEPKVLYHSACHIFIMAFAFQCLCWRHRVMFFANVGFVWSLSIGYISVCHLSDLLEPVYVIIGSGYFTVRLSLC